MTRCIIFSGDFDNLGDAFLAETEAIHLMKCGAEYTAVAPYQSPPLDFLVHFGQKGIDVIPIRTRPIKLLQTCVGADIWIGGGHAIRENVSLGWLFCVFASCLLSKICGHYVRIVGAGASPIRSIWKRWMWLRIFGFCDMIWVRDNDSKIALNAMLPSSSSIVHIGSDLAFLRDLHKQPSKNCSRATAGRCVISPAFDSSEDRAVDLGKLEALISMLLAENIIFGNLCVLAHDIREHMDGEVCATLTQNLKQSVAVAVELSTGPISSRLLDNYIEADLIITGRLHGMIIGAMSGVPVCYFGNQCEKMRYFAGIFDFLFINLDDTTLAIQAQKIDEYIKSFDKNLIEVAVRNERSAALRSVC